MDKQPLGPNQQKWVDALRSGKYNQGYRVLQNGNGYCCLGVACDVAKNNGIKVELDINKNISGFNLEFQIDTMKWLDIRTSRGQMYHDVSLVSMNDEDKYTFNQIANAIEDNAHLLFKNPR